MAKKKVEVNEDMLKDIMVGDIPVFGREDRTIRSRRSLRPRIRIQIRTKALRR